MVKTKTLTIIVNKVGKIVGASMPDESAEKNVSINIASLDGQKKYDVEIPEDLVPFIWEEGFFSVIYKMKFSTYPKKADLDKFVAKLQKQKEKKLKGEKKKDKKLKEDKKEEKKPKVKEAKVKKDKDKKQKKDKEKKKK